MEKNFSSFFGLLRQCKKEGSLNCYSEFKRVAKFKAILLVFNFRALIIYTNLKSLFSADASHKFLYK